jgi:hypothetical protein
MFALEWVGHADLATMTPAVISPSNRSQTRRRLNKTGS